MSIHVDIYYWIGLLLAVCFFVLVILEVVRYFETALSLNIDGLELKMKTCSPFWSVLLWSLLFYVLSRVFLIFVFACCRAFDTKTFAGFWDSFLTKLTPWDAPHYIEIIEHGYVNSGEPRLYIVFFPFYPLVCKVFSFATGFGAYLVSIFVSNVALILSGCVFYRLVEMDSNVVIARRSVVLLMFFPLTYFYSLPYSESLFLLVTLLSIYFARNRKWFLSVLFGIFSSNTRVLGLCVAIPVFWEMLCYERSKMPDLVDKGSLVKQVVKCVLKVSPILLGFVFYLLLNFNVYGNPFQFLIYQREHWYQSFGGIANTFVYCFKNLLSYDDIWYRFGVWGPQVFLIVFYPILLFFVRKRLRSGDVGYSLVYHYVSFMTTWLLSGLRYFSGDYVVYLFLSKMVNKRWKFWFVFCVECLLFVCVVYVGLWHVKIY